MILRPTNGLSQREVLDREDCLEYAQFPPSCTALEVQMTGRTLSMAILALVPVCGCSSGGGGSSKSVSDDCLLYLECMEVEDPANADLYKSTYGKHGECWSAGASEALDCTQECQAGIEAASLLDPAQTACWKSDLPDAQLLFSAIPIWSFVCTAGDCHDPLGTFSATASGQDFSLSLLWQNGFSLGTQCTIAVDLSFTCDPTTTDTAAYFLDGAFNAEFSESTLNEKINNTPSCTFHGVPGM
jgi:hypothetical protein